MNRDDEGQVDDIISHGDIIHNCIISPCPKVEGHFDILTKSTSIPPEKGNRLEIWEENGDNYYLSFCQNVKMSPDIFSVDALRAWYKSMKPARLRLEIVDAYIRYKQSVHTSSLALNLLQEWQINLTQRTAYRLIERLIRENLIRVERLGRFVLAIPNYPFVPERAAAVYVKHKVRRG